MQYHLNLPSASSQRLRIVTVSTIANDARSEKPTKPSGHDADHDWIVMFPTYAPVLTREECTEAEPAGVFISTRSGPNLPKLFADGVEALRYLSFAILRHESPRFRPASLLTTYLVQLDTVQQPPPQGITRPRAMFPLSKLGMVSIHACFQFIAEHMLGTDSCLEFILHRVSPCGEYLPAMIWFHGR